MAHGYAGVKEQGHERFATAFAEAGFVVLVHDHRNFGASDGTLRHDIDPWRQIADWRRAISLLETVEGGHFDSYLGQFAVASAAATSWFSEHLRGGDA